MLVVFALIAAISLPPKPDHYVTDRAGVITNPSALDAKLAEFERQTSDQILVYVDQHLPPDTTIEEMGSEAMKQWGVGQKGKDNGAILFVFVADRKMRIEVGYGLEATLTDAQSSRIIETVIKPEFRDGKYNVGIENGVSAMLATVRGEFYRGTRRTVAEGKPREGAPGWLIAFAVFWTVGMPLLLILATKKKWLTSGKGVTIRSSSGWSSSRSSSWSSSSSSSSSFSDSSSSSSSSSFSGGGGSGGGGGASGSW